MIFEVKLEKLSGQNKSGKVAKIFKTAGDSINVGDELFDVEAKKGNVSVLSDVEGKIVELIVEEGDNISIGDVLFTVEGEKKEEKKSGFNYMGNFLKPQKIEEERDLVIIGGGPGGYVAAIEAAKEGLNVALIEKDNLGGTCLNRGCIPTKAFVRSAEVYGLVKNASKYGIESKEGSFEFGKIVDRKNGIVNELVGGIEYLLSKHNVTIYKGLGEIMESDKVFVKENNKEITITTKNIIISTGSNVFVPPIKGIESKNVLTSNELLNIRELPEEIVIIGGGVIGMEFAFICNELDKKVSVVEFAEDILIALDKDVRSEAKSIAKEKGIKIYTSSKVEEILDTEDGKSIVVFDKNGKKGYISGNKVLVSVGRRPNLDGIDTEKLGIELNDNSIGIKVNEKLETSVENIYAIGDVNNIIQLAHVASYQGTVAVKNIVGEEILAEYDVVPSAIFTMPEIASVGITEDRAIEDGLEIKIGKFPFAANGKALTLGENKGFVKIIADKNTDRVLGGSIIGPNATDLIHEIAVSIKNALTVENVIDTIHAHPTTAESVLEGFLGTTEKGCIHFME